MVSTAPADPAPVKRGPGRPAGSKNKPKPPIEKEPPVRTTQSEPEKIVAKAKADEAKKIKDKSDPPDFTEWQSFIGEVILHWFSVAFIAIAFRGVPYHDVMSDEDYEDIQLDDEELAAVARPFAHLATHSGLNSKYGRAIMNSRDSIEATVILVMWGARVRRISSKYRFQWKQYQLQMESQNVARIDRPDRVRDSNEEVTPEQVAPIVGLTRPAFGHGFN